MTTEDLSDRDTDQEREAARAFFGLLDRQQERAALARVAYDAASRRRHGLASHRMLTYRCARRCLLLEVLRFPEPVGLVYRRPRYKLSPATNSATSSESGRAHNTEDGDRRWKSVVQPLDAALNFTLSCDHLEQVVVPMRRVQDDLRAQVREATITPEDHDLTV